MNFLTGRTQAVVTEGTTSNWQPISRSIVVFSLFCLFVFVVVCLVLFSLVAAAFLANKDV